MNMVNNKHWSGVDFVKGLLILCVFMGHIIPGSVTG